MIGDSPTNEKREYIVSAHEKENPLNRNGGKTGGQAKTSNRSENVPIKRKKKNPIESEESNTVDDQNEEILSSSLAEGRKINQVHML